MEIQPKLSAGRLVVETIFPFPASGTKLGNQERWISTELWDTYDPFMLPALFRTFAAAKADHEGMARFVAHHGSPFDMYHASVDLDAMLEAQGAINLVLWEYEKKRDPDLLIGGLNRRQWGDVQPWAVMERDNVQLYLRPSSLLDAMWLQLALHAADQTGMRQCANHGCGKWFAFGSGTGRRNTSRFCSDACRVANHNRQSKLPKVKWKAASQKKGRRK